MEQEQTPKQVQPEDTETIQIEERDAKRELNIILIMAMMWIMSIIVDDSHRKLREAFIFNHDNILVFCCRLDSSTRLGKDSLEFAFISEILPHDQV